MTHKREGAVEPNAYKRNIINTGKIKLLGDRLYVADDNGTWVRFMSCPNLKGLYFA